MTTIEPDPINTPIRVGQPCEDDSIDEAAYRKEFITAVEIGLAEIERGEVVSFEEIKKEFSSWFIK